MVHGSQVKCCSLEVNTFYVRSTVSTFVRILLYKLNDFIELMVNAALHIEVLKSFGVHYNQFKNGIYSVEI
jgi:hypothetical protein